MSGGIIKIYDSGLSDYTVIREDIGVLEANGNILEIGPLIVAYKPTEIEGFNFTEPGVYLLHYSSITDYYITLSY